jgi:predicted acyltransferase
MDMNLAIWADSQWLPGKKHFGTWDPEGLITTIPAVASCLIGVIVGHLLVCRSMMPVRKSHVVMLAGVIVPAAGYAWSWRIPIMKN